MTAADLVAMHRAVEAVLVSRAAAPSGGSPTSHRPSTESDQSLLLVPPPGAQAPPAGAGALRPAASREAPGRPPTGASPSISSLLEQLTQAVVQGTSLPEELLGRLGSLLHHLLESNASLNHGDEERLVELLSCLVRGAA